MKTDEVTVVTVGERLDEMNSGVVLNEVNRLIQSGARNFVIDLGNVRRIDTRGLGELANVRAVVGSVNGRVL